MTRLALWLALALVALPAQRDTRRRPPETLPCSRDQLTSFTGKVTVYSRTPDRITLTIATDWDTTARFTLRPPFRLLLHGEPFQPRDWDQIEEKPGVLRKGMRATVWECAGGRRVLDWQPPPDPR